MWRLAIYRRLWTLAHSTLIFTYVSGGYLNAHLSIACFIRQRPRMPIDFKLSQPQSWHLLDWGRYDLVSRLCSSRQTATACVARRTQPLEAFFRQAWLLTGKKLCILWARKGASTIFSAFLVPVGCLYGVHRIRGYARFLFTPLSRYSIGEGLASPVIERGHAR